MHRLFRLLNSFHPKIVPNRLVPIATTGWHQHAPSTDRKASWAVKDAGSWRSCGCVLFLFWQSRVFWGYDRLRVLSYSRGTHLRNPLRQTHESKASAVAIVSYSQVTRTQNAHTYPLLSGWHSDMQLHTPHVTCEHRGEYARGPCIN